MGNIYYDNSASGRSVTGRILEATTVIATGNWVFLGGVGPLTVVAHGDFVGTLNIRVSNKAIQEGSPGVVATKPLLGDILSQAGWIYVEGHFLWVAAELAAISSGTLQGVDIYAGRP